VVRRTRHGGAGPGAASRATADLAGQAEARQGEAWFGLAGQAAAVSAGLGVLRLGGHGRVRRVMADLACLGWVGCGRLRYGGPGLIWRAGLGTASSASADQAGRAPARLGLAGQVLAVAVGLGRVSLGWAGRGRLWHGGCGWAWLAMAGRGGLGMSRLAGRGGQGWLRRPAFVPENRRCRLPAGGRSTARTKGDKARRSSPGWACCGSANKAWHGLSG
jgi:hypothetical protein